MFNYVGDKIKGFSKVICWLGIATSVIIAIVLFVNSASNHNEWIWWIGFVILIVGPFLSWFNSLLFYGFGTIVESVETISHNGNDTSETLSKLQNISKPSLDRSGELKNLLSKGLITEEDYEYATRNESERK